MRKNISTAANAIFCGTLAISAPTPTLHETLFDIGRGWNGNWPLDSRGKVLPLALPGSLNPQAGGQGSFLWLCLILEGEDVRSKVKASWTRAKGPIPHQNVIAQPGMPPSPINHSPSTSPASSTTSTAPFHETPKSTYYYASGFTVNSILDAIVEC